MYRTHKAILHTLAYFISYFKTLSKYLILLKIVILDKLELDLGKPVKWQRVTQRNSIALNAQGAV